MWPPIHLRELPLRAFARKKPFAPSRLREKKTLCAFAPSREKSPSRLREKQTPSHLHAFARKNPFTPSREKPPSPLHAFARKQTYRAYVSTSKNSLIIIAVAPHTAFPSTQ
jgi:hypothetical protein